MGRPLEIKEAVYYGKFVEAAYSMFKRDPNNLKPEPQPSDVPAPYEFIAWRVLDDFQRAVDFVKAVSDAAGMEDLRKRDETERGVVPPFYVAFGAADGKNEIGFVLMVARDEAIEARFGTAENEIGHVTIIGTITGTDSKRDCVVGSRAVSILLPH